MKDKKLDIGSLLENNNKDNEKGKAKARRTTSVNLSYEDKERVKNLQVSYVMKTGQFSIKQDDIIKMALDLLEEKFIEEFGEIQIAVHGVKQGPK